MKNKSSNFSYIIGIPCLHCGRKFGFVSAVINSFELFLNSSREELMVPPPKPAPKKVDITKITIPVWAKVGKLIWVEILDELGLVPVNYLSATIDKVIEDQKKVEVTYSGEAAEKEIYADRILERADQPQILEDLVDIDPLNDAELLRCLEMRYRRDMLYCFCGPTLLATNPYKKVTAMTLPEDRLLFKQYALKGGKRITLPHIWNISSRAFYQLFDNNKKQAMCISGESGAGKTFGTKLCMGFITALFEEEDAGKGKTDDVPIEDKILACNPIMESFGNSKTVRNDNSSRFGKYFIMYVDKGDKHIKGAEIRNYLLEKSRVVIQAETERNYHIFYAVIRFMPKEDLKKYGFCNDGNECKMDKYNYLLKSKTYIVETVDDNEFYTDTCKSFKSMGFAQDEVEAVWKTLSCTLNLGNVEIDQSGYIPGEQPCGFKDGHYLQTVLQMTGLDKKKLIEGCTVIKRTIQGQTISSPRTPIQAEGVRDALAKDFFNNVFNWIVRKLNLTLLPENPSQYITIGLLDIFGFEDFKTNSLEQFCINYTNEKLQNLYISYVFKAEKVSFEEEGLGGFLSMIKYTDNQPIIDMLDKKPTGIFHLINSVGMTAKDDGKDDEKLVDQITKAHEKSPYMSFEKLRKEVFCIKHTAKKVTYYSPGFTEKNKDELPKNLLEAMEDCDKVMLRIFKRKLTDTEEIQEKIASPEEKFLGYKFRQEMQTLMDELLSCECSFVRCIKPNEDKRKDYWVPQLALNQIRYLGILDSINVRRESLPVRKIYEEFYAKYKDLDNFSAERNTSYLKLKEQKPNWKSLAQNTVKSVVDPAREQDVLWGSTKIFMSNQFVTQLEEKLEEKQKIKRKAIDVIGQSFRRYEFIHGWNKYRVTTLRVIDLSKNLFATWNSKVDYMRFKKILSVVRKAQYIFKFLIIKRNVRLQKYATEVIGRSFRLYKIRDNLFKSNFLATSLMKTVKLTKFRHFQVKVNRSKEVTDMVFEKAWEVIENKMKIEDCKEIQRMFRGWASRQVSMQEVQKLETIKAEVKKNRAATLIQKIARGFLVRTRLDRLHRAAGFIQGYTRMLWLSKYYQLLRKSTKRIQVFVRKYLLKNRQINERMGGFLTSTKQYIRHLRKVEHDIVFKQKNSFFDMSNLENYTKVKFFEDEKSFRESIPKIDTFVPELPAMELNPKMRLFSVLIDFDCQFDTSDVYERSWAVDFLTFVSKIQKENSRLLHLEVGESFTLAITDDMKVYSWGLNDFNQLARKIDPKVTHNEPRFSKALHGLQPRVISSGDEHTIMVDYANDVYIWGGNSSGQLGIGHSRDNRTIVKLASLGKGLKDVVAKGKRNYVVSGDGDIFTWPNKSNLYKFVPCPVKLVDPTAKFSQVVCGHDFTLALSVNGTVFSQGKNMHGQLGLGDQTSRDAFTQIESLRDYGEKIVELSAGHQHAICKTATGKVFTWGNGEYGQLGLGSKKSVNTPTNVKGKDNTLGYKARSVQATYCSSYILYETRKVFHAGPDSSANVENLYFKQLDFEHKVTDFVTKVFGERLLEDLTPLRIYGKWSRGLSLVYLVVADFREVPISKNIKDKIALQVHQKWEEPYSQGKQHPLIQFCHLRTSPCPSTSPRST